MSDRHSQSTCLEMLHPKTDKHVEEHHLVGKLSTAETLLTEVQREVPCPGKHLFVIRERLFAHLVYKYIKIYSLAQLSVNKLLLLRDMM